MYGPGLGYQPLRESIADWLSSFYLPKSGKISPNRLAITSGASQNLASILQVFSSPDFTRIWMVEPTYFLACTIFEDAGFSGRMRGIPETEHGVDISFLRDALTKLERVEPSVKPASQYESLYRHILYLVPTFSNPGGKTYSVAVREELLALAREYDILIISDDVYDFLRWGTE
jgi:DNA-binding transcriptional MocR family regulator